MRVRIFCILACFGAATLLACTERPVGDGVTELPVGTGGMTGGASSPSAAGAGAGPTGGGAATGSGATGGAATGGTSSAAGNGAQSGAGATSGGSGGEAVPSGGGGGSSGSTPPPQCTDSPPPDQMPTCAQWLEWDTCGQDWFAQYCDASCGRCTSNEPTAGSGGAGSGGAGSGGAGGGGAGGGSAGSGGLTGENPYPPIENGCPGYATRYWDCCKPHCAWTNNVPGGVAPLATCNQSDGNVGNANATNSCDGGDAFMCHRMAPWAASNRLAYGYAATGRGDICGRCYQLQFSGRSHNAGNDPGSAALAGKTMIVQATNVGGDVGSGQFDILTPGGGVGIHNACSEQWGISTAELGAQYGGLLTRCKEQVGGADHQAIKSCMSQRCTSVFESRGLSELAAGCRWFVEWFEAADNPALVYKEIPCPQELTSGGMNRNSSNVNAGCGI
jgi:hypothetical protein